MSLASMINIYNYKMVSCGAATILHALKVCGLLCGYGVERKNQPLWLVDIQICACACICVEIESEVEYLVSSNSNGIQADAAVHFCDGF